MKRIGLTGGIATGKSHVRAAFERLGIPTIDADTLARAAVAPGTSGLAAVVHRFGADVLASDGTLNRSKLGGIVFADAAARRDLEAIIHPFVREETTRWFDALDPEKHTFAIADIPLLYEAGREGDFDAVIVTACAPATQLQRLIARDGLSEAEAQQRIAAQLPVTEKARRADHVIHTDGSYEDTERQVSDLVQRLS